MSDILIGEMYECNFFGGDNNRCGTRNFLNFSGFGFGLPTLAVLAMRQNRIMAAFGCVQWLVLVGVLLVNQGHAPRLFYRNMINCDSDGAYTWIPLTSSRAVSLFLDRNELLERA